MTVKDLITEIDKIKVDMPLLALYPILSLPDLLAKIDYPEIKGRNVVGERYKKWLIENNIVDNKKDAEELFKLRNAIFHSSDIDDKTKRTYVLSKGFSNNFVLRTFSKGHNEGWISHINLAILHVIGENNKYLNTKISSALIFYDDDCGFEQMSNDEKDESWA